MPGQKCLIFFHKKILIFREMELSGLKIKNFLIFSQETFSLYFEKWNFLPSSLRRPLLKISYILGNDTLQPQAYKS